MYTLYKTFRESKERDKTHIIDLDTKTKLDTQAQATTVKKKPNNKIRPGARGALYLDTILSPPPKPPELTDKRTDPQQDIGSNPNLGFEENSPHQEGIISEMYVSPDQSYFEKPQVLIPLLHMALSWGHNDTLCSCYGPITGP